MNKTQCRALDRPLSLTLASRDGFTHRTGRILRTIGDTLLRWQERAAQRTRLASLDDRLLRDIGLSRADVDREVSLPFWRER